MKIDPRRCQFAEIPAEFRNPDEVSRIVVTNMRRLLPFAVAAALLVVGCKSVDPEKEVQGTWTVTNATATNANPQIQQAMKALNGATYEIKPDHKFKYTAMNVPVEGDWSVSGRSLTMSPKTVMNQPIETMKNQLKQMGQGKLADKLGEPTVLTLKEDNKTLEVSKDGVSMTLTKK